MLNEKNVIHDLAQQIEKEARKRATAKAKTLREHMLSELRGVYPRTADENLRIIAQAILRKDTRIPEEMIFAEIRELNQQIVPAECPIPRNPFGSAN